MNKKLKVALAIGILSVTTVYAADGFAGTENDPLVTKSYVDKVIANIKGNNNSGNTAELEARLSAQEQVTLQLLEEISALKQSKNAGFEIVTVPAGKTIYGKQGSEIIIRSGEGTILSSAGGGVQDVTDGVDLSGGASAPNNNLLIVPREDGRGIVAAKTMVVMVRGGYTVK